MALQKGSLFQEAHVVSHAQKEICTVQEPREDTLALLFGEKSGTDTSRKSESIRIRW